MSTPATISQALVPLPHATTAIVLHGGSLELPSSKVQSVIGRRVWDQEAATWAHDIAQEPVLTKEIDLQDGVKDDDITLNN